MNRGLGPNAGKQVLKSSKQGKNKIIYKNGIPQTATAGVLSTKTEHTR